LVGVEKSGTDENSKRKIRRAARATVKTTAAANNRRRSHIIQEGTAS
jgi:hypothetical protein